MAHAAGLFAAYFIIVDEDNHCCRLKPMKDFRTVSQRAQVDLQPEQADLLRCVQRALLRNFSLCDHIPQLVSPGDLRGSKTEAVATMMVDSDILDAWDRS